MNDTEAKHQKELVRQLCTQSNRVFRLELCVKRYLEQRGLRKEEIRAALDATRLGDLEPLTAMLEGAPNGT